MDTEEGDQIIVVAPSSGGIDTALPSRVDKKGGNTVEHDYNIDDSNGVIVQDIVNDDVAGISHNQHDSKTGESSSSSTEATTAAVAASAGGGGGGGGGGTLASASTTSTDIREDEKDGARTSSTMIAELQAQKAELVDQLRALLQQQQNYSKAETTTETLAEEVADTTAKAMHAATETVKRHIAQLHQYNALRDIATGLMGLIAEARGVRVVDVYADFDVAPTD